MPSHLYRNLGDGKFQDVSQSTGISSQPGKAWGVVAADINNDGYTDLFVSNDTMPNFLWANRGGKKFEQMGLEAGVAYSNEGCRVPAWESTQAISIRMAWRIWSSPILMCKHVSLCESWP